MSDDFSISPIDGSEPARVAPRVNVASPAQIISPTVRPAGELQTSEVDAMARGEVLASSAAQHQFDAAETLAGIHDSAVHGSALAQAIEHASQQQAVTPPAQPPNDAHERMLGGAAAVAGSGMTSVERGRAEKPNKLKDAELIPDVVDGTKITPVRRRGDDPHDGKHQRGGEEER